MSVKVKTHKMKINESKFVIYYQEGGHIETKREKMWYSFMSQFVIVSKNIMFESIDTCYVEMCFIQHLASA